MKLNCKECSFVASSLSIDRKIATQEVLSAFAKHTMDTKAHPNMAKLILQDTMKVSQLSTAIIMIAKYSTLLDLPDGEENYLQEDFSKLIDDLQEALGVEVTGESTNGPDSVNTSGQKPSLLIP
jgi:hypothetical protein